MSSAIKSFLVMLITLPLLIYIGNEVGNEDYVLPFVVCVLVVGTLVIGLFFRGQRVECLLLAMLLGGNIVGNRGFAQLYVVQPLYIGEVGMSAILALLVFRYATAREFRLGPQPIASLVGAYLALALIRLICFDWHAYGIEAIRDSAIVYYAIFFFIGYNLGRRAEAVGFLDKVLIWVFFSEAVVGVLFVFEPDWLDYVTIRGVPLFLQKGDLTATFSAMGIVFVAVRPDLVWSRAVRYGMILLLATSMFLTLSRAALLAMGVALALTWVAARRGFLIYPAVLGAVGLAGVFAFGSISNGGRLAEIGDELLSVVDVSSSYHYQTELGEGKEGDNMFRRALWTSMINQTVQQNQWLLGKGFGYDFMPTFEQEYQAGSWDTLRSAHNYFVTVFGRLGLVGFGLFAAITLEIIRLSLRSALKLRRREEHNPQALAYWCCVLAILASGAVGVVLEGPMGAIPFWTMLGLALATDDRFDLARKTALAESSEGDLLPPWIPSPLLRPAGAG